LPTHRTSQGERFPGKLAVIASPLSIEECWIDLAGGRMRYLKAGSGRALILVHGLLGYAFSWRFAMPALAAHATVYAVDNLGAGLSVAPANLDCTARATAKRLLGFAEAVGIREFDLLGTSHGGGVSILAASICAARRAPRLRRLILVASVNPWSSHGKRLAPFLGSRVGSVLVRNSIERWRFLDAFWLRRMFGDASKIPADSLAGYRVPVLQNHGFRHARHIVKNWSEDLTDIQTALSKIRQYRTLLIWGTKDRIVSFRSAQALRQSFQNARLIALEGVGHLPYEEAPEEFNQSLIRFLSEEER
jgi:pimeloyl-ACP methyl ester carboxylesterase